MRSLGMLVCTAALLLAAACSSATPAAAPPPTTAATPTVSAADRAAVEKTYADFNAALVARDFATACSLTDPAANDALVKALTAQGVKVTTCEEAFKAVYAVPAAAAQLDEATKTTGIDDVAIAGDVATVTYRVSQNGQVKTGLTKKLQRFGGQWKLLGVDA
jgi:predicted lipid-binding transport protein (Tim44 family)